MPYDDSTEKGAEEKSYSFFLPSEYQHDCKPGDILKFRVIGKDSDGDTEVEPVDDKGGDPWKDEMEGELSQSMSEDMGGAMQPEAMQ